MTLDYEKEIKIAAVKNDDLFWKTGAEIRDRAFNSFFYAIPFALGIWFFFGTVGNVTFSSLLLFYAICVVIEYFFYFGSKISENLRILSGKYGLNTEELIQLLK